MKEKMVYVPIYNGEKVVERVLERIKASGYLNLVTIIDDGSTDSTPMILRRWHEKEGLDFERVEKNMKKIGVIRKILSERNKKGELPEKIILHDGDSFLVVENPNNASISYAFERAANFMDNVDWSGAGFKVVPFIDYSSNLLEKIQFWEYIWSRRIHLLLGKRSQMYCISGAGGIFKTDSLLKALELHSGRHEGDDMETTVLLQKLGYKVGYYSPYVISSLGFDPRSYPEIVSYTSVPSSFRQLLKQRIRWTEGQIETYLQHGSFYIEQIKNKKGLGFQTLFEIAKLTTYPFWIQYLVTHPDIGITASIIVTSLSNAVLLLTNPEYKEEFDKKSGMLKFTLLASTPFSAYSFTLDILRIPPAYIAGVKNYFEIRKTRKKEFNIRA
jgi:cellulose synthase/poly-beta-1,6-N-acetylglucosamine synthase-like glycosyltransferase